MTRVLDRLRSGRLGIVAVILLVLLVLVVAHALVMGAGHGDEMVCGSCVVVIATGLAAVVALRPRTATAPVSPITPVTRAIRVPPPRILRPPSLRSAVLRL